MRVWREFMGGLAFAAELCGFLAGVVVVVGTAAGIIFGAVMVVRHFL